MTLLFTGGRILTEKVGLLKGDLLVRDGKIAAIGEHLQTDADTEIIDATERILIPGLIDTHNHGCCGTEFAAADEEFDVGTTYLAKNGITTVVPTVRTLPKERMLAAIRNIKKEMVRKPAGAKLAGINMEGPFISPNRIGSMLPENLSAPSRAAMREYLDACEGTLRTITMAPELPEVIDMIGDVLFAGANAALGHTCATYAQARAAVDAGARVATHLYNAMSGFTHREPGMVGEGLTDDRLICELICDFVHSAPASVDLAIRSKGVDKIVMISDNGVMSGLGDGEYIVENRRRIVKGNLCITESGVIAGSVCNLFYDVRNLLHRGYPLADVSLMASLNPARLIGISAFTGSIAVGKAADLLLLDTGYNLLGTWVDGVKV